MPAKHGPALRGQDNRYARTISFGMAKIRSAAQEG